MDFNENDWEADISKKMYFEEKDFNHDISKMTDEWYKGFSVWLDKELSKPYELQCYMFCGDCVWFDDDDTPGCGISNRPRFRYDKLIRFNILFLETFRRLN